MIALAGRAFRFLSSEVRGLHAAAYVLAVCALLSSLLALARDRLFAQEFGASATLDIYYAAFRIPDLIFVATGALVSVYILIPELVRRSEKEQREYLDTIVLGFSLLAISLSGVVALGAPALLALAFPEYTGVQAETLVWLTRLLLIQPIFLGLSNIVAAVTQARHRYAIYALSPLLYNLGIIIGIVSLYPMWGMTGLALGVILGAFLHLAIQIPSVLADGFFLRMPRFSDTAGLWKTVSVSVPRALALSMNQITFFMLVAFGATLATGSVAVFVFAYNLHAVPLAIIGASYSVAAFPTLARALAQGEKDAFVEHVAVAVRYVIFWSVPASALILVLRAYIVRVVLGSGAFDWTDTRLTAAAFALLALSLVSQGVMLLLVRAYYAAGKTFVPFFVSLGMTVATVVGAFALLRAYVDPGMLAIIEEMLRVPNVPGTAVLGLAIAYSTASILGTVVMVILFERRFGGLVRRAYVALGHACVAGIVAGACGYAGLSLIGMYADMSSSFSVFLTGLGGGVCGIAGAALAYALVESPEYRDTIESLRARLWRGTEKSRDVILVSSVEE